MYHHYTAWTNLSEEDTVLYIIILSISRHYQMNLTVLSRISLPATFFQPLNLPQFILFVAYTYFIVGRKLMLF